MVVVAGGGIVVVNNKRKSTQGTCGSVSRLKYIDVCNETKRTLS